MAVVAVPGVTGAHHSVRGKGGFGIGVVRGVEEGGRLFCTGRSVARLVREEGVRGLFEAAGYNTTTSSSLSSTPTPPTSTTSPAKEDWGVNEVARFLTMAALLVARAKDGVVPFKDREAMAWLAGWEEVWVPKGAEVVESVGVSVGMDIEFFALEVRRLGLAREREDALSSAAAKVVASRPDLFGSPPRRPFTVPSLQMYFALAAQRLLPRAAGGAAWPDILPGFDLVLHHSPALPISPKGPTVAPDALHRDRLCLISGSALAAGTVLTYQSLDNKVRLQDAASIWGVLPPRSLARDELSVTFSARNLPSEPVALRGFYDEQLSVVHWGENTRATFVVRFTASQAHEALLPYIRLAKARPRPHHFQQMSAKAFCRGKPDFKTCGVSRMTEEDATKFIKEVLLPGLHDGQSDGFKVSQEGKNIYSDLRQRAQEIAKAAES